MATTLALSSASASAAIASKVFVNGDAAKVPGSLQLVAGLDAEQTPMQHRRLVTDQL